MKDWRGGRDIKDEILKARDGRAKILHLKLVKSYISMSLNEQRPLRVTLHHQLTARTLPQPPCEGVVRHQRLRHRLLDHLGWVTLPQSGVVALLVEEDQWHEEAEPLLVVDVR